MTDLFQGRDTSQSFDVRWSKLTEEPSGSLAVELKDTFSITEQNVRGGSVAAI